MNKHIELVKKYLADPTSVTKAELKVNRDSADYAYRAANAAYYAAYSAADYSSNAAYYDADAVARAAYFAAYYAYVGAVGVAAYWVKLYEELLS